MFRDIILIAVGVLLALAAESWREFRVDRSAERVLLGAMRDALKADMAEMANAVAREKETLRKIAVLQEHMRSGAPYADSLAEYFGAVYAIGAGARPNRAAYEGLKELGLQRISNDSLRLMIVSVFEDTFVSIERRNEINFNLLIDQVHPYFLQHFTDLRLNSRAVPLNYAALRRDEYFANLLANRVEALERNTIGAYGRTIDEIDRLIRAIEAGVGGRR